MQQKPRSRRFLKGARRKSCKGMPKESVEEFLRRGGKMKIIPTSTPEEVLGYEILKAR